MNVLNEDPQFVGYPGAVVSGIWDSVSYDLVTYQTRLGDEAASWGPGELAGLLLKPSLGDGRWLYIVDNDIDGVWVWADMTSWVLPGDLFKVHDLRLSGTSPAIDVAGDGVAPVVAFYGNARIDIPGVGNATSMADIGAIEYQP